MLEIIVNYVLWLRVSSTITDFWTISVKEIPSAVFGTYVGYFPTMGFVFPDRFIQEFTFLTWYNVDLLTRQPFAHKSSYIRFKNYFNIYFLYCRVWICFLSNRNEKKVGAYYWLTTVRFETFFLPRFSSSAPAISFCPFNSVSFKSDSQHKHWHLAPR